MNLQMDSPQTYHQQFASPFFLPSPYHEEPTNSMSQNLVRIDDGGNLITLTMSDLLDFIEEECQSRLAERENFVCANCHGTEFVDHRRFMNPQSMDLPENMNPNPRAFDSNPPKYSNEESLEKEKHEKESDFQTQSVLDIEAGNDDEMEILQTKDAVDLLLENDNENKEEEEEEKEDNKQEKEIESKDSHEDLESKSKEQHEKIIDEKKQSLLIKKSIALSSHKQEKETKIKTTKKRTKVKVNTRLGSNLSDSIRQEIKTMVSKQVSKSSKGAEYMCKACKLSVSSKEEIINHLTSKLHRQNVRRNRDVSSVNQEISPKRSPRRVVRRKRPIAPPKHTTAREKSLKELSVKLTNIALGRSNEAITAELGAEISDLLPDEFCTR
eukprot:TRINITY_DN483_c5_g1_i1.p1 TRINITY_DN483_c5_g1~~TRINITY_DN483_c5_g1_i1.p1  ORF type:complete len:383 (-),score=100.21 TRINITY_DN483_c5_g1_i1:23-1171(-)